jgi:hypothetical protein
MAADYRDGSSSLSPEGAWADTDTVGLVTVMRQAGSTTLEDVVQLTGRVWQATRVTISG